MSARYAFSQKLHMLGTYGIYHMTMYAGMHFVSPGKHVPKLPSHMLRTCSAQALMTGKFNRMIFARMSRNIPMSKFLSEMVKDLTPRLKGTGEEHQLKAFEDYFKPKKIVAGATMLSLWDGANPAVRPDDSPLLYASNMSAGRACSQSC